jgi:hypothetical protein
MAAVQPAGPDPIITTFSTFSAIPFLHWVFESRYYRESKGPARVTSH